MAETAKEQAPVVRREGAAAAGAPRPRSPAHSPFGTSHEDELKEQLNPDSTARQDNPYPQGDLP